MVTSVSMERAMLGCREVCLPAQSFAFSGSFLFFAGLGVLVGFCWFAMQPLKELSNHFALGGVVALEWSDGE